MTLRIDILTAFPAMVDHAFTYSMVSRAVEGGFVEIKSHDLRDYSSDKFRSIDDAPYGGGTGMILKAEPYFRCLESILEIEPVTHAGHIRDVLDSETEVVLLAPYGVAYKQELAVNLSLKSRIILLCGHYKGIDQRVADKLVTKVISIGDYICSGGEYPAMVLVDSIVRLIPGVLHDAESALTDSFQDDLLDCAHYTRPAVYRGMEVPKELLSGNHKQIEAWREKQKWETTAKWRPDLVENS